jgi:hypothetical protein
MSLNKKRPLAALYFGNRIIQGHFPLRAFIAPNMSNPFRGAHSFSSVNAPYLHGISHPSLLTRYWLRVFPTEETYLQALV